jgi:hypothetical protein
VPSNAPQPESSTPTRFAITNLLWAIACLNNSDSELNCFQLQGSDPDSDPDPDIHTGAAVNRYRYRDRDRKNRQEQIAFW